MKLLIFGVLNLKSLSTNKSHQIDYRNLTCLHKPLSLYCQPALIRQLRSPTRHQNPLSSNSCSLCRNIGPIHLLQSVRTHMDHIARMHPRQLVERCMV